jgi:polyhydroxybutyrate depolymerase
MQNFKSYGFVLLTFGFLSSFAFGQNILLTEDFDDSSLPDGWTQQSQASDGGWLLGTNSELQSDWWSIAPNGHFIATNDDGCDCDKSEDYLIMPELNLAESEAVMLQFDAYYDGGTFEGDTEVATIEFSLDEGFTWEVLETIEGSDDGEWNSHTISLNQLLGESDVLLAFRYNDNGGWVYGCAIDDVVVFEPSGLDAALSAVNVPNTVNLGETISVGGTVTNTGLETISSLELSWSIGENEFVAEYTDLILEAGEVYAFDHPDELTVDDMGSLQLNVSIVSVNGGLDSNPDNDSQIIAIAVLNYGTITAGGIEREYIFYRPASASANCPLVYVCHGYTGSAQGIMDYSGFNALADIFGFAVCYPQGIDDSFGNAFWNVGYDFQNNETVDDVAFLQTLTDAFEDDYGILEDEVFCTGMSNGGDFCYLLACEASEDFKAVAPISGMIMQNIMDNCSPLNEVPILEIHGTNDNVTYYDGDPNNNDGWGAYPSIPATIDFFVNLFGLEQEEVYSFEDVDPSDGSEVNAVRYGDPAGGCSEVRLYTVEGGGHDWPGAYGNMDIDASLEAWLFFEQLCQNVPEDVGGEVGLVNRRLVSVVDLLGRKSKPIPGELRLFIYSDGTVEKRMGSE